MSDPLQNSDAPLDADAEFDAELAALDKEIDALQNKPNRTPDEDTRLEALKGDRAREEGVDANIEGV